MFFNTFFYIISKRDVYKRQVDSFIKNVGKKYKEKTDLEASFYIANIGDGAGRYIK